ncbi:6085_t:CDS:2 [Entrophospora sp. SA101]|nr:6085_t:CDS:2 [Entrophospora sp. SA101]
MTILKIGNPKFIDHAIEVVNPVKPKLILETVSAPVKPNLPNNFDGITGLTMWFVA